MRIPALLLSGCVLLSGCHHAVVRTTAPIGPGPLDDSGASFLALTRVNTEATECPHGLARVESYQPVWGVLVYFFTAGLVSGMTSKYWCVAPPQPHAAPPLAPAP